MPPKRKLIRLPFLERRINIIWIILQGPSESQSVCARLGCACRSMRAGNEGSVAQQNHPSLNHAGDSQIEDWLKERCFRGSPQLQKLRTENLLRDGVLLLEQFVAHLTGRQGKITLPTVYAGHQF